MKYCDKNMNKRIVDKVKEIRKLFDYIEKLVKERFSGEFVIVFYKGGIRKWKIKEEGTMKELGSVFVGKDEKKFDKERKV